MAVSGKINRWNIHQRSSFEQLQYHRERRMAAREQQQKMSAIASNFSSIQVKQSVAMGDITSRVAMTRMGISKKA